MEILTAMAIIIIIALNIIIYHIVANMYNRINELNKEIFINENNRRKDFNKISDDFINLINVDKEVINSINKINNLNK